MKRRIISELVGVARDLVEVKRSLTGGMATDGGPGSGNFGHEGRPGQVGGSAPAEGGGGGGGESKSKSTAKSSGGKIKSGMTIGSSSKGKQLFEVSITPKGETKPVDVYVYAKNRMDASNELITNGYYGKQHSVSSHSSNFLEAKEKNRETPSEGGGGGGSGGGSTKPSAGFEAMVKRLEEENRRNDEREKSIQREPSSLPASPLQRQIRNMGSQAFFKHHGIENEAEFEKLYKEGRIGDVDYGQIKAELGREKKGMASANNALGRPLTAAEVRSIGNRNPTVETLHADFSLKSSEFRKAQEGYRNGKVSKERYDSALKEKNDSFDRLVEAEKYADGASSKSSSEGKSGFENSPAGKIAKALGKENEFNDRIKQNMAEAPVDRTEQEMAGLNRTDKTRQIVSELRGNSQKQSQAPRKFKSPQEEKEYYRQEWKGAIDRMQHYGALARRRIRSGLSDDLIKQAQSEYRTAKAQAIEFEKKHDSIP